MFLKNTSIKLIKYYNFINYNLIYNNKAINRYKKDNYEISTDKIISLEKLKKSINDIKNCDLKKNAINMVFSDGNPKSKIMFVGEAPGANEDEEGLPFVGRAGMLLDKMLSAIDLDRKKFIFPTLLITVPQKTVGQLSEKLKDIYLLLQNILRL